MTQRTRISKRTSRKLSSKYEPYRNFLKLTTALHPPTVYQPPMQRATFGKSRSELEYLHKVRCQLEQAIPRDQRRKRNVTLNDVREYFATVALLRAYVLNQEYRKLYPDHTEDGWAIVRHDYRPANILSYKCRAHEGFASVFPHYDEQAKLVGYQWSILRDGKSQHDMAPDLDKAKRDALNALALMVIAAQPAVIAVPEKPKTAAARLPRDRASWSSSAKIAGRATPLPGYAEAMAKLHGGL